MPTNTGIYNVFIT